MNLNFKTFCCCSKLIILSRKRIEHHNKFETSDSRPAKNEWVRFKVQCLKHTKNKRKESARPYTTTSGVITLYEYRSVIVLVINITRDKSDFHFKTTNLCGKFAINDR